MEFEKNTETKINPPAAGPGTAKTSPSEPASSAPEPSEETSAKKKTRKERRAEKKLEKARKKEEKKAEKKARKADSAGEKQAKQEKKQKKQQKKNKGSEKEHRFHPVQKIENGAAAVIDAHDRIQAAVDRFFAALLFSILYSYHQAQLQYKENFRRMMSGFFGIVVVVCMLLLIFDHFIVYQYSYNGRVLGYVKDQNEVYDILDVAGEELSNINDANIKFTANSNVTFKKVSAANKDVDQSDEVLNKLTYMTEIEVIGYGIYEGNNLLAVLDTESNANQVLDDVLNYYRTPDSGMKIKSIKFKNHVEVKPVNVLLTSVQTREDAEKMLEKGGDLKINHIVMEDETMDSLSNTYGMNRANIVKSGEDNGAFSVTAGDEVKMTKTVQPITVSMSEYGTMKETVKYKVVKKKTKDMYRGDTAVKQKGENGSQLITGTIYYENGKEVNRDIKSKEVLKKTVDEILLVGTNDKPKWYPTGTFKFPVANPVITSYFGSRWGTTHEGLDFSASTGTPIYASDGGTVIRASNFAGYGLCVDIQHKNGTFTRYGHNSKLLVSAGDKVAQGEKIALAGSTGHSTGPHCHFEIHPNGGAAVDPYPYLYGTTKGDKVDSGL